MGIVFIVFASSVILYTIGIMYEQNKSFKKERINDMKTVNGVVEKLESN